MAPRRAPRPRDQIQAPPSIERSLDELERAITDEFARRRAETLRRFVASDAFLERVRAKALQDALRQLPLFPQPEHERRIMRSIDRQLSRMTEAQLRRFADDVEHAAQQGGLAAAHTRRLLSSQLGADAVHGTTDLVAGQSVNRAFLNPRLRRLSDTLWRDNRRARTAMREALGDALRGGRSVTLAADRLLVSSDPVVHLPRYMREIEAAARSGNTRVLWRSVRKHIGTVRELGEGASRERGPFTLRQHVEQFIKDAQGATHEDVDRAMRYYLQARARYQARMVARTEMSAALNDAYAEAVENEPFAAGVRWNLAPTHPKPDICDMYAEADPHGLGKGTYTNNDAKPPIPAHPHCHCFWTTAIDRDFARRRLEAAHRSRASGESVEVEESRLRVAARAPGPRKSFHDWLADQPPHRRRAILGHGRTRRFDQARTARERARIVNPRTGRFSPLWQIDGRTKPGRSLGPAIRVIPDPRHDPGPALGSAGRRRPPRGGQLPPPPRPPPPRPPPTPPPPPPDRAGQRRAALHAAGYTGPGVDADVRELGEPALTPQALRKMAGELEGIATKFARTGNMDSVEQRRFRSGIRRLIRTADPDYVSNDVLRQATGAYEARRMPIHQEAQANASHDFHGATEYASRKRPPLAEAFRRMARGIPLGPDEHQALRTAIHEELHGASSIGARAYRGIGRVLEEASVELRARRITDQITSVANRQRMNTLPSIGSGETVRSAGIGSYDGETQHVLRAVARVRNIHGRQLDEHVQSALTQWFGARHPAPGQPSGGKAPVNLAFDLLDELAALLHPEDPARMAATLSRAVP